MPRPVTVHGGLSRNVLQLHLRRQPRNNSSARPSSRHPRPHAETQLLHYGNEVASVLACSTAMPWVALLVAPELAPAAAALTPAATVPAPAAPPPATAPVSCCRSRSCPCCRCCCWRCCCGSTTSPVAPTPERLHVRGSGGRPSFVSAGISAWWSPTAPPPPMFLSSSSPAAACITAHRSAPSTPQSRSRCSAAADGAYALTSAVAKLSLAGAPAAAAAAAPVLPSGGTATAVRRSCGTEVMKKGKT